MANEAVQTVLRAGCKNCGISTRRQERSVTQVLTPLSVKADAALWIASLQGLSHVIDSGAKPSSPDSPIRSITFFQDHLRYSFYIFLNIHAVISWP
jgi:hypothetical protein